MDGNSSKVAVLSSRAIKNIINHHHRSLPYNFYIRLLTYTLLLEVGREVGGKKKKPACFFCLSPIQRTKYFMSFIVKKKEEKNKMLEIDTSVLVQNHNSKREPPSLHRDMSDAYPKFDEYEIIKGRTLQEFGDFAVVHEIDCFASFSDRSVIYDEDYRDDIESRAVMLSSEAAYDRYVVKTLVDKNFLETEIRILSNMHHPNIIQLKGTPNNRSIIDGGNFLVLERLHETLTMRIDRWNEKACVGGKKRKTQKQFEEKMHIAYDIISAIEHLNKHCLIHRGKYIDYAYVFNLMHYNIST